MEQVCNIICLYERIAAVFQNGIDKGLGELLVAFARKEIPGEHIGCGTDNFPRFSDIFPGNIRTAVTGSRLCGSAAVYDCRISYRNRTDRTESASRSFLNFVSVLASITSSSGFSPGKYL
jgi:hypothetical protein